MRRMSLGDVPHRTQGGGQSMAKAAVAGKQATVTMRNLAAKLSEDHELSKKQTEAVLGDLVGLIAKHLKKGDRIRIGGPRPFPAGKRAAPTGPKTGPPRANP